MASSDTTQDFSVIACANDARFQDRCYLRWLNAAIAATTESVQATTSVASSATKTLTFASQPGSVAIGWSVTSLSNPSSIPASTFVVSLGAGMGINNTVTVAAGDIIVFAPPNHTQRMQFAAALFANAISRQMLAMLVLANATNRTNCLADTTIPGGNILDSDIDFQINSILTGVATSRNW